MYVYLLTFFNLGNGKYPVSAAHLSIVFRIMFFFASSQYTTMENPQDFLVSSSHFPSIISVYILGFSNQP